MRVVVTRIEPDGSMQRRVVDTARRADGPRWEDLAARALASPQPPYRPIPGTALYHLSVDDRLVQVGGQGLRAGSGRMAATVARTSGWLTAEYNNQKSGSTFVTIH